MLEKTSLGRIRSVLYVLYVLKPAKRADFSMIGRFVNFLMYTGQRDHLLEVEASAGTKTLDGFPYICVNEYIDYRIFDTRWVAMICNTRFIIQRPTPKYLRTPMLRIPTRNRTVKR